MPHDVNKHEVRPGDRVAVECTIKTVELTEDYCNVTLTTVEPMHPGKESSSLVMNARQVRLIQPRHDGDYTKRLSALGSSEVERLQERIAFLEQELSWATIAEMPGGNAYYMTLDETRQRNKRIKDALAKR